MLVADGLRKRLGDVVALDGHAPRTAGAGRTSCSVARPSVVSARDECHRQVRTFGTTASRIADLPSINDELVERRWP
jgi:hypothetical protein